MQRITYLFGVCALMFALSLFGEVKDARAQITIEFGGNFGKAKQALIRKGYTQIVQVGQGFTKLQIEACQNGIRYWFKSDSRGNVNQKRQIGVCQQNFDRQGISQLLASQGFTRINVEDRGNRFIAVVCRGNERMRLNLDTQGRIQRQRVLGQCQQILSPADVQVALEREGYTRIRFLNRRAPVYGLEACQGLTKMYLEVDQFGKTIARKRVGECRRAINPDRIARYLQNQGFERIVVIDDRLPRYVAEVCEGRDRLEITLNRFGDIINRQTTGTCQPEMNRKDLVAYLRDRGFSRIKVIDQSNNGYTVEGCHSGRNIRLEFNRYGEFLSDKELGDCKSWRVEQVYDQLANKGLRKLKMTMEGCNKDGRLIRYEVDKWGGRANRQVIGRCQR